ncbi:MAG TPA: glycosyltransferase family 4 protein [Gemmataceae bacterium]|nr:glycosyltransferase family 4 protein [Gemmataceae bacterium]
MSAFRPFLERAGHRLELRSFPESVWGWFQLERELSIVDAVILQRKLIQPWQLYLLQKSCRTLVYDFDDAVFLRDSYAPKGLVSRRRQRRFTAIVQSADRVIAGNAFLQQEVSHITHAPKVVTIPTCLDPSEYPVAEHRHLDPKVQLVWIGSSSTLVGLERIKTLLDGLGQTYPRLQLKLICDRFLDLQHLSVIPCSWSPGRERELLAAADIGISWLPDDRWSRGKCGLKVLQYMAAGLPVVANPVGVQAEMVRHGETGFLAHSPRQWIEAIGRLAHDPDLRRRMGRQGRRMVETHFNVARGAAGWLAILEEIQTRRKSA